MTDNAQPPAETAAQSALRDIISRVLWKQTPEGALFSKYAAMYDERFFLKEKSLAHNIGRIRGIVRQFRAIANKLEALPEKSPTNAEMVAAIRNRADEFYALTVKWEKSLEFDDKLATSLAWLIVFCVFSAPVLLVYVLWGG